MDPLIIVFGLGVGLLVGLTGVGGGSLMTPLLIIVFGVKPVTAVGTDVAYAAITKTVGGLQHLRQRTVDLSLSTWMAFGSLPAAIGGVYVLELLKGVAGESYDHVVIAVIAGAVLLAGTATLTRIVVVPDLAGRERHTADLTRRARASAIAVGVFVGFVLGVTSAGSGALIAVALILIFRLVPHRVVGTDVFHAAILLWGAAIAHVVAGNVDYGLMGNILVGSVPGIWLGSVLSVRVPTGGLRLALSVVLLGAGLGLLSKAGLDVPPAVLAAFPLAVGAIAAASQARHRRRSERELAHRTLPGQPVADA
jgi:uncharacterized membrane protein YfcA